MASPTCNYYYKSELNSMTKQQMFNIGVGLVERHIKMFDRLDDRGLNSLVELIASLREQEERGLDYDKL